MEGIERMTNMQMLEVSCPCRRKKAWATPSQQSSPDEIGAQIKRAESWCMMQCRKCRTAVPPKAQL